MLTPNQFQNLHQAARPANNGQSDFVPLLLQHGDERGVAHAHRREAIHRHDHVPTLQSSVIISRSSQDDGFNEERLIGVVFFISANDTEAPAPQVASA